MTQPLPPLNALRAFEAIARHLSFARAAEELHVTPAALSHQIRALEEQLGLELFTRRTRSIELTDAGRALYPGLHAGFESVRGAVARLDRERDGNVLVISATAGPAAKWLVPRLWRFLHAHPDIDARVSATHEARRFRRRRRRCGDSHERRQASRPVCREAVRRCDVAGVRAAPGRAGAAQRRPTSRAFR